MFCCGIAKSWFRLGLITAFLTSAASSFAALPSGYEQLHYIESTGKQYIDTGIAPSADFQISATFRLTATGNSRNYVFGCYNSNYARCQFSYGETVCFGYGGSFDTNTKVTEDLERHSVALSAAGNSGKFYLDGVEKKSMTWATDSNTPKPIPIFSGRNGDTFNNFSSIKLYSFSIAKEGVPLRKFVPAKRTSDNVIGLYDLVSSTFFTNNYTGADAEPFLGGKESGYTNPIQRYSFLNVTGKRTDKQHVSLIDYVPNGATVARGRYAMNADGTICFFCARESTSYSESKPVYIYFSRVGTAPRFDYLKTCSAGPAAVDNGKVYDVVISNGYANVYQDGVQKGDPFGGGQVAFTAAGSVELFSTYSISSGAHTGFDNNFVGKFYSLSFEENGEVVHNLVPCVEDGIVKVMDRVTGMTYFNGNGNAVQFTTNGAERIIDGPKIASLSLVRKLALSFEVEATMETAASSVRAVATPGVGASIEKSAGAVAAGGSVKFSFEELTTNTAYLVDFYAGNDEGEVQGSAGVFYTGEITVVPGQNGDESSMTPATFVLSRDASDAACAYELVVNYTVTGTDGTFTPPSGVAVIPAGESSVTVEVYPKYSSEVTEDVDLALTLNGGNYSTGGATSAKVKIISATDNPLVRYVATPENGGDDANSGATMSSAKATIQAAIDALAEYYEDNDCQVILGAGVHVQPKNVENMYCVYVNGRITITSLSGNAEDVIVTRTASDTYALFSVDHKAAVLKNITIANGRLYGSNSKGVQRGAGVCLLSGAVEDCIVSNCTGTAYGQVGIGIYATTGSRVSRCVVAGCTTTSGNGNYGAGIRAYGGLVEDCLVTRCSCGDAGAISVDNNALVINCTVVDNTGTAMAGIRASETSPAVNCAIFGNKVTASNTGSVYLPVSAGYYINCASDLEIVGGVNCIVCQPVFRDAANGDYRPTVASGLVDTGSPRTSYVVVSTNDLAGCKRVVGSSVDIGCYEYQNDAPDISLNWSVDKYTLPVEVTLKAKSVGLSGETYSWTLQNTTTGASKQASGAETSVTLGVDDAGTYTISVAAGGLTYTSGDKLQVSPEKMYVDKDASAEAFPYDTPAKAAKKVNDAVAAAADGATIYVAPRVYTSPGQVTVAKAIRITGTGEHYTDTVITNIYTWNEARIFVLQHPEAQVDNLTMAGGYVQSGNQGGNLYITGRGGTVSNCLLTAGRVASQYQQGGGAALLGGGLLTHCEITNCNTIPSTGNPATRILYADNARVSNCYIHDCDFRNGGDKAVRGAGSLISLGVKGILDNCTIVDVVVTNKAAVIYVAVAGGGFVNSAKIVNNAIFGKDNNGEWATVMSGSPAWNTPPTDCFKNCVSPLPITVTYTTKTQNLLGSYTASVCRVSAPAECFVNASSGDHRPLKKGSLVDFGGTFDQVPVQASVDLRGKSRIVGTAIDVGAWEYQKPGLKIFLR